MEFITSSKTDLYAVRFIRCEWLSDNETWNKKRCISAILCSQCGSDLSSEHRGHSSSNFGSDGHFKTSSEWNSSQVSDDTSRFDPMADETRSVWTLEEGQSKYVNKYFTQFLGENMLRRAIKKDNPKPHEGVLMSLKLDENMLSL